MDELIAVDEDIESPKTIHTRLRCADCGHVGRYDVGHIYLSPFVREDIENLPEYVFFTGYFRCRKCKSAGPWEFTGYTRAMLICLILARGAGIEKGRLFFGVPILFDGTISKSAAQAEEYLKGILDREPENAFVWNRLGNIYYQAGMIPDASDAFTRALQIDPDELESHFSLGAILLEKGDLKESAEHLHRVFTLAYRNRKVPEEKLRDLVSETLNMLFDIGYRTDGEIPVFPTFAFENIDADFNSPFVVELRNLNLKDDGGWEQLIDMVIGNETMPEIPMIPSGAPYRAINKTPRNATCPCGSGKKFKKCCGR